METATNIPAKVWISIQKLPPESLKELIDFIEDLNQKNISETQVPDNSTITSDESDRIIEEIFTEISDSLPYLSDYAMSRAGIYEEHP